MTGPRSEAYTPPQFDSVEQILDSLIMREALDTLRMAHRQVLRLAYDRDLTQSQIAERLGLPLAAFQVHLRDCAECQSAVAEFESMARALKSPAPAVELPPGLEAKVVASVQRAVLTARQVGEALTITRPQRALLQPSAMRKPPSLLRQGCPGGGTGTGTFPSSRSPPPSARPPRQSWPWSSFSPATPPPRR
jgi:hypothetical protein